MAYIFKKADISDIELLTVTRVMVLRAANQLDVEVDLSLVEKESYEYYKNCFKEDSHVAYLVFANEELVGTGGISFFKVMPTYHNPSGKKAYIMNMFTKPEFRRKGIANKTLCLLVEEAKRRGIQHISLEATEMGRPLYQKYGFINMQDEMILPKLL
jgi:Predicted acetyltransferase involved in intracellular survival and related acetyltransferases